MSKSSAEIIDLIDQFYGDTSRSRAETKGGLEDIQSKVETYLDSLQDVDSDEVPDTEDDEDDDDDFDDI